MKTECDMNVIKQRIKSVAALRGVSIKSICDAIGAPTLWNGIARGKKPSIISIYKLCEYLDVSIDYICGRTEHMRVWRD